MTITGIAGRIGSGKSFEQLRFVLEQAQKKQLQVVTNFSLNFPALIRYATYKKYWWILSLIDKGCFTVIDTMSSLEDLIHFPNSVIAADEMGIFLNSREFAKTPKKLLMDLCQSRKFNANLVWAAQFDSQVDLQFRELTQYWVHCAGISQYDKKIKRPKLIWKRYYSFDADTYKVWLADDKARKSHLVTRFMHAHTCKEGPLNKSDKMLFECFDSFARLDEQKENSKYASGPYVRLSGQYYFEKMGSDYRSELDPFSKKYVPLASLSAPAKKDDILANWEVIGNSGISIYRSSAQPKKPTKKSPLSHFRR